MEKQKKNHLLYGGILAVAILIGASACGFLYLGKNRLQAELTDTRLKLERIEKKYAREKTLAQSLMGSKQSQEGILRGMEMKVKEAQDAAAKVVTEKDALKLDMAKREDTHKKTVLDLTKTIEQLKKTGETLAAANREKVEALKKQEKTMAELNSHIRRKEGELKRTEKKLDVCREHNERLCTISEDLVEMYKNKGLVKVFSVTEPLTQLRKVEMEKLVQLYKGKIEKNREKDLESAAAPVGDSDRSQN